VGRTGVVKRRVDRFSARQLVVVGVDVDAVLDQEAAHLLVPGGHRS
jgi:hypothetical protein